MSVHSAGTAFDGGLITVRVFLGRDFGCRTPHLGRIRQVPRFTLVTTSGGTAQVARCSQNTQYEKQGYPPAAGTKRISAPWIARARAESTYSPSQQIIIPILPKSVSKTG